MRGLKGRIRRIEDQLGVNKQGNTWTVVGYQHCDAPEPPEGVKDKDLWQRELLASLGPHEEWLTVKSQREEAVREFTKWNERHWPRILNFINIKVDPCAELEARKQQKVIENNNAGGKRVDA